MSDKKSPTAAGAAELQEEDLEKVRGGTRGNQPLNFKVEIEGVTQGAIKGRQGKKA